MNAFRFRLERILRWRALELSKEETRVKQLMENDGLLARKIEGLQNEKAGVESSIRSRNQLDGADLNALAGYAVHSVVQLQALEVKRTENKRVLAQQLQRYRAAKQRHRALEELRHRQLAEWQSQGARELEELADDSYRARAHALNSMLPPEA